MEQGAHFGAVEIANVTREELAAYLEETNKTATWLAYTLGVTKATASRWLNGETPIPETVDKLLRLLIRGENPFKGLSPEPATGILKFTDFEWRLFDVMRTREGFDSVEEWIVDKIRIYNGLSGAIKNVAESLTPSGAASVPRVPVKYPKPKRGGEKKSASSGGKADTTHTPMIHPLPPARKTNDKKA